MRRRTIPLVLCLGLCGLLGLAGCQRQGTSTPAASHSKPPSASPAEAEASAKPSQESTAAPSALSRTFSVPFRGILTAKYQGGPLAEVEEITYTIGDGRIRREATKRIPLGKLAKLIEETTGVICDVPAGSVLLYHSGLEKKRFVRLTLPEYREQMTALAPDCLNYVGTFFYFIPATQDSSRVIKVLQARTVGGLLCDLYSVQFMDEKFEAYHAPCIQVERELLELVEWRLPAEVTGFPCLLRHLKRRPVAVENPQASQTRRLLQQGVRWAIDQAEKAIYRETELCHITEGTPSNSAFTLDATFIESPDLGTLSQEFASSHGGDFD